MRENGGKGKKGARGGGAGGGRGRGGGTRGGDLEDFIVDDEDEVRGVHGSDCVIVDGVVWVSAQACLQYAFDHVCVQ